VRSLFSFALRIGYIRVNPASVIAPPPVHDRKHARLLSEAEALALVLAAPPGRDRAFVRTLYSSGARVSELCALTWADVLPSAEGATLYIWGKGGKQRQVGISQVTDAEIMRLRASDTDLGPVFGCDRTTGHRIVKRAAYAAGIIKPVSAHWFRDSHASHALARGASAVDVQEQLLTTRLSFYNR
jgi:integrase/recombinase XerD